MRLTDFPAETRATRERAAFRPRWTVGKRTSWSTALENTAAAWPTAAPPHVNSRPIFRLRQRLFADFLRELTNCSAEFHNFLAIAAALISGITREAATYGEPAMGPRKGYPRPRRDGGKL